MAHADWSHPTGGCSHLLAVGLPMWVAAAIAVASMSSENVGRIETRAPGRRLWVSAVARPKGTFFLVLTLEFLGLWAQGGWGDLIGQSRVYVWSHPLAVWPYIAAIASVGLSLHRLPYVRQDVGEQAV